MTRCFLAFALIVAAAPAAAQSPSAVPLRENTPSPETTVTRPGPGKAAPGATDSVRIDPNARNRSDGRVAPPAAIDTGVQVIAPEKR